MPNTNPSVAQILHSVYTQGLDGTFFTSGYTAEAKKLYDLGEANAAVGEILDDLRQQYSQFSTLIKLAPVEVSDIRTYTVGRYKGDEVTRRDYDRVQGDIEFDFHQGNYERVTRQLSYNPKYYALAENFIDKEERRKLLAKDGGLYGNIDLARDWAMETMEDEMRFHSVLFTHSLATMAAQAPLFTGSDDLIDRDFVARGAVITPVGGTLTTVYNPLVHIDTPPVGYEDDFLTDVDKFLTLMKYLAKKRGSNNQRGGTFYMHRDGNDIIQKIKTTYPEYFDADYGTKMFDAEGLFPNWQQDGYSIRGTGINIVFIDDMVNSLGVYGNAGNTWMLLKTTIDTRNLLGFFIQGGGMPLTIIKQLEIDHAAIVPAGNTYVKASAHEFLDKEHDARANVTAVYSKFRLSNADRVRGAITL